jgi:hypothetical protein
MSGAFTISWTVLDNAQNVFGRRLIILVAVLMGLTALAASVAPPPETARRARPTPTAPPVASSPTPTAGTAPASAGVVTRHIDATTPRAPVTITVPRGDTLQLAVDVGAPDTVVLDDLDLQAATPGSPAQFELLADTPGEFPLRLLEAERALGVIRVSAASAAR